MAYLLIAPCIAMVCYYARKRELPDALFLLVFAFVWVLLFSTQWVQPGAEALIATSVAIASVNLFDWLVEDWWDTRLVATNNSDMQAVEVSGNSGFCSRLTHDCAVDPSESVYAVQMVNMEEWQSLLPRLAQLTVEQRQGFYANLNYSSISERALMLLAELHPDNCDSHVLFGHLQFCKAKRLGMVYGKLPSEGGAVAIGESLMAFRRALAINPHDAEALFGILIVKTSMAMSLDQVRSSFANVLAVEPRHYHAIATAARHLVTDGVMANEFIGLVETNTNDDTAALAFAGIAVHVQCQISLGFSAGAADAAIDDLHSLYQRASSHGTELGNWQNDITANLYAYALQNLGPASGSVEALQALDRGVSPYPWQMEMSTASDDSQSTKYMAGDLPA